jgi:hypothetical protein
MLLITSAIANSNVRFDAKDMRLREADEVICVIPVKILQDPSMGFLSPYFGESVDLEGITAYR